MKNKEFLPVSPHLQIYKPQLTSMLSIAHRITGFCLSLTLPLFLVWIGCVSVGFSAYETLVNICSNNIVRVIFTLMTYGFSYHMLNGIRHMIWDLGYGLSIKFSSITAIIIIILSFIITLIVSVRYIF